MPTPLEALPRLLEVTNISTNTTPILWKIFNFRNVIWWSRWSMRTESRWSTRWVSQLTSATASRWHGMGVGGGVTAWVSGSPSLWVLSISTLSRLSISLSLSLPFPFFLCFLRFLLSPSGFGLLRVRVEFFFFFKIYMGHGLLGCPDDGL